LTEQPQLAQSSGWGDGCDLALIRGL